MTIDIFIVLFIILLAFILFVSELLPMDVVALAVLSLLLITGQLDPNQGISGFSNPAVITIAILFVLSHALQKSGVLEYLVIRINRLVSKSLIGGLTIYLISIAISSANLGFVVPLTNLNLLLVRLKFDSLFCTAVIKLVTKLVL